ncbi:MAG TPA: aldehyde dehydrogenase family protein [Chthoniobacterales bacterium]|nr:aldehyde dehydrogenase family protein [Chthoniobacterales bacterium]
MKTRRAKRKMATRKKLQRVHAVVVRERAPLNYRVALPPGQRRLSFGDRWDYAPAPEASSYIKVKPRYQLFIGGKFVAPRSGKYFGSINPATEEKLAEIADANARDVDLAVKSARRAYNNAWSKMPGRERGKYLYRIARLIQEKSRELAVLESMDGGKTIKESRDIDLPLVAAHFFYHAGWSDKLQYAFPGRLPRSLGVAGQIIPWNFPLLMAAWKLAPALACGNTCVLKPAETTSITAMHLAEIFQEAELPEGVVNIVTGAGETGRALVEHPNIDKIAFTGSTEVGKRILHSVAGTKKKLTLELGGKAANIIFEDAPIDQAVEGIISGIYFNQGHVCCAGSRLFVQEGVFAPVIRKLRDRIATLRVGNPLDKNTDIGAINSRMQLEKICELVDSGVRQGAKLIQPRLRLPAKGYWYPPSFFTGVTASHRIAQEEIFGPVLSVMTFRTPDEAIERANNTPYGLSAGVWTDKGSKIFKIVNKLRAGVVWANTYNKFDPTSPFGGYKESGFGREGGLHGLLGYLALNLIGAVPPSPLANGASGASDMAGRAARVAVERSGSCRDTRRSPRSATVPNA